MPFGMGVKRKIIGTGRLLPIDIMPSGIYKGSEH